MHANNVQIVPPVMMNEASVIRRSCSVHKNSSTRPYQLTLWEKWTFGSFVWVCVLAYWFMFEMLEGVNIKEDQRNPKQWRFWWSQFSLWWRTSKTLVPPHELKWMAVNDELMSHCFLYTLLHPKGSWSCSPWRLYQLPPNRIIIHSAFCSNFLSFILRKHSSERSVNAVSFLFFFSFFLPVLHKAKVSALFTHAVSSWGLTVTR